MKNLWVIIITVAFVVVPLGSAADFVAAGLPHSARVASTNYTVIASLQSQNGPQWRDSNRYTKTQDNKNKDKRDKPGKGEFHGAEMTPGAILLAAVLAISAYLFMLRRRSHQHV